MFCNLSFVFAISISEREREREIERERERDVLYLHYWLNDINTGQEMPLRKVERKMKSTKKILL